jgi:hypothetical protein
MWNEPDDRVNKTVSSGTRRNFFIQSTFFQNGSFFIITEGEQRIGAISISINASGKVNTAKVIPSKYDSIFINTIAEKVSAMINGICLVSLYSKSQLQLDDMKAIMGEVMNIVGSRKHNEDQHQ